MKKLIPFLIVFTLFGPILPVPAPAQNLSRWPGNEVYARWYGTERWDTVLTVAFTSQLNRSTYLIVDGGPWYISNNIVVPTNIALEIRCDSPLIITGTNSVGFLGGDLIGGYCALFGGSGQATGTANYLLKLTEWGPTNTGALPEGRAYTWLTDFNFVTSTQLVSTLTNYFPLLDTNMNNDVTNIVDGGTLGSVGTVTETTNRGGKTVTLTFPVGGGGAGATNLSYLNGLFIQYYNTTVISVTPGEGYCAVNAFQLMTNILYTPVRTAGVNYIIISNAACTYPHALSLYNTTNSPVYNTNWLGWYSGATTADMNRCIGAIWVTNYTALPPFVGNANRIVLGRMITLAINQNPSGAWQTPSIESSAVLPVMATKVTLLGRARDNSSAFPVEDSILEVAPKEIADMVSPSLWAGVTGGYGPGWSHNFGFSGWAFFEIPLGVSRNIRWAGEDDDDNSTGLHIIGWEITR